MAKEKYRVGFDLGGTKMLAVLLDEKLELVGRNKEKSQKGGDEDAAFEKIVGCIENLLKNGELKSSQLEGIGIAIPGPIDRERGIVLETPNLGFKNFPLRDKLKKEFNIPVNLENDVNAGLYGEFRKGAARKFKHIIGLFPGTGLGGGIIIDGKLYRGAGGGAGEIGHMIIQVEGRLCGCGQHGCLESLASKTAIAKDAVFLAAKGDSPYLYENGGTDFTNIKSGRLKKAIDAGDSSIQELIDRAAYYLGIGMANCVNIFNPELIVLGGGLVEKFGKPYVEAAGRSMHSHAMASLVADVEVFEAELGDDAAIIGAAALLDEVLDAGEGKEFGEAGN